jgi:hypothetical protein
MHTTRVQFDPDLNYERGNYTKFPTRLNPFNVYCGSCHGSFYVDKDFYEQTVHAMEEGIDSPFLCDDCQDELDDSRHQINH